MQRDRDGMDTKEMAKAFLALEGGGKTDEVKIKETHISWVFLTEKHAYKVKKPVDFGFLDFTTLEKRRKYTELELELNRRLCPGIYLAVLPLTEKSGRISVGGGNVIDYALKMKRLPEERLMKRLLERGAVGNDIIEKIARKIATFHSKAETNSEISEFGTPERIWSNWEGNLKHTEGFIPDLITMDDFVFLKKEVKRFMEENRELFEKRVREGRVRRNHGDLHSGNIFIIDGEPMIFDCIEFNMEFSCIDVCADVSFMSMDLDYTGRKDLSDLFIEKYTGFSKDYEIKKLLNFYKCYYAWVRGEVTALRLKQGLDKGTERKVRETASKYLRLALDYARKLE